MSEHKIIKCLYYPCILVKTGMVKDDINDTKLFTCIPELNSCAWGYA